jgi:hypothetical protein
MIINKAVAVNPKMFTSIINSKKREVRYAGSCRLFVIVLFFAKAKNKTKNLLLKGSDNALFVSRLRLAFSTGGFFVLFLALGQMLLFKHLRCLNKNK